jgi:hypothetical protein
MSLQHVNVKIFAAQSDINLADAIPVFHRWIQEKAVPELLIDVADYKHVPDGPGVMLIGHQADYSLDETDGKLGLLYNRKVEVPGDSQAALAQAFQAAQSAAKRLEEAPELAGKLTFDYSDIEIIVNDRIVAPNTKDTWDKYAPEIEQFFATVFGAGHVSLTHIGEPRDRFRVSVKKT